MRRPRTNTSPRGVSRRARGRLEALRGRADAWKRNQDELTAATHRVTELSGRLATAEKARDLSRRRVAEVERELETVEEAGKQLAEQRGELLPADRKPADERRRMEAELLRADEAVEAANHALATAQQAVSTLDHLQADRGARRASLEAALRDAEADLRRAPRGRGQRPSPRWRPSAWPMPARRPSAPSRPP